MDLHEGGSKFTLRVCFKHYSSSYEDSLSSTNLPVLKSRKTLYFL